MVGIVRKRRFPADRVIGAEVEPGGVPALALAGGGGVRIGFLYALLGPQRKRAEAFAAAVNATVKRP